MPDIAALQVAIGYDDSAVQSGAARTSQTVSGLGSTIQTALGAAAVGAVAGLGAAFVGSVKTAMDFEHQMSAVGAVAGASAAEMQQLTSAALQLGKDTSFSAGEAAKGIEELVKAGVSIQDVIGGGARAALDLAAAGAISVGDAAEIASNAMNVFNLTGGDMAHVADVIAGAANASAIGVNDYKFSLAAAGAVANTVGISFESLSEAIAVMGNAGIKGSDAGTSLKTMMLNLQPTTKAQIAEFERLGIAAVNGGEAFSTLKAALLSTAEGQQKYDKMTKEGVLTTENMYKAAQKLGLAAVKGSASYERWLATSGNLSNSFFDAEGKAKSFAEIADVLQDAMAGMTKEQQLASLEILFGADAIRAAAVMAEAGAEGFAEMAEAMGKVTARQVAEERLNNLAGSLEKLKGSLETAAIMLGGQFTPALKRMADGATDAVNSVIDALEQIPDAIETVRQVVAGEWAPASSIRPFTLAVGNAAVMVRDTFGPAITTAGAILQQLVGWVTANLAPIAAFVAAFTGVIATAGLVTAAIAAVAAVLGFLLSPLGLVAVAVATLAVAWQTNFLGIQEATAAAWAVLEPVFAAMVDWLGAKIPPVLDWISGTGWPALVTAGQAVGQFVTSTLIPSITQLVDWLGPKLQPVVTWLSGTGFPALVTAATEVQRIGLLVIQFVKDLWAELEKRGIVDGATQAFTDLHTILEPVFNVLSLIVGIAVQVISFLADLAVKGLESGKGVQFVADQLQRFFGPIAEGIGTLAKFIELLRSLGNIQMPSWWGSNPFGGGGGGSVGSTFSTMAYSGGADSESKLQRAYQIALSKGFTSDQASAMLGSLRVEGGLQGAVGDSGQSHGPFQLYEGGQFPNFAAWLQKQGIIGDPKQLAKDIEFSTAFALDTYYGAALREGTAAGLSGPALATYAQRHGQVSINPEKAGGAYGPPAGGVSRGTPGRMDKSLPDGMRAPLDLMETVNRQFMPQWVKDMETITDAGVTATATVSESMASTGATLVSMSTDDLGNVTRIFSENGIAIGATITDAAGVIVNAWGTMATAVPEQTNLMVSGALTSVTALGDGVLTTVHAMSGDSIATVTDMAGQVTSQYATLSNGAQITMGDMAAGVLTSTTSMGDGMVTIVQDAAGNYIATVTDLHGNVTSQYTQLAGDVTGTSSQMSDDVTSTVSEMASETRKSFDSIRPPAEAAIEVMNAVSQVKMTAPDVSKVVSAMHKIESAANDAYDAVSSASGKGGHKGGDPDKTGDPFAKRAFGGPVDVGETYLIGERGPELFVPRHSGTVIPNDALVASGQQRGGDTYIFNGVVPETVLDRIDRERRKQELMYRIGG